MKNNLMNYGRWLVLLALCVLPVEGQALQPPADSSSVEWLKPLPADYSVALPGNMSNSSADLIGSLEMLIDRAQHSIDLAIYDLEHPSIGKALADAKIAAQCGCGVG